MAGFCPAMGHIFLCCHTSSEFWLDIGRSEYFIAECLESMIQLFLVFLNQADLAEACLNGF
jgi:hypothetical protein